MSVVDYMILCLVVVSFKMMISVVVELMKKNVIYWLFVMVGN